MPADLIVVSIVIICCSLIQSMFGVGILLFGTPVLLLLGYPFETVLFYLLPCSISINVMQIVGNWKSVTLKRSFVYYCLPFVIISLVLVLSFNHSVDIKKYVGFIMLLTALMRMSQLLRAKLSKHSRKYLKPSLVIIGSTHGVTNMGGGFLSLLASSLHVEKDKVRSNIAYGYLMMACCQVVVLLAMGYKIFAWETIYLMAIAVSTYFLIGNRIYMAASTVSYQRILTVFISLFGLTLLLT